MNKLKPSGAGTGVGNGIRAGVDLGGSRRELANHHNIDSRILLPKIHPKVEDVVHHLIILKAFQVLKELVISGHELGDSIWTIYVANATRRFIMFVSSLKESFGDDLTPISMEKMIPPLDICLIWYSACLNPSTFYDNFVRFQFLSFLQTPFPLKSISKAINTTTFKYEPSTTQKDLYLHLISPYFFDEPNRLHYTVYKNHIKNQVNIRCPICTEILVKDVVLINEEKWGFLNDGFKITSNLNNCKCNFNNTINHEELAKRKLYKDLQSGEICGVYKSILDSNLSQTQLNAAKQNAKNEIILAIEESGKRLLDLSFDQLLAILRKRSMKYIVMNTLKKKDTFQQHIQELVETIIKTYSEMKLIYLTNTKSLPEDDLDLNFVDCALNLNDFNKKMNQLNWLQSPFLKEILSESCIRYGRWIEIATNFIDPNKIGNLTNSKKMLTPTLDIDLIWRTNLLISYSSSQILFKGYNVFLDTCEDPEQVELDIVLTETALRYKQKYRQDYQLCFCNLCVSVRNRKIEKYESWVEQSKSKDSVIRAPPVYQNSTNKDSPPDYGNSTKSDLPPDYGNSKSASSSETELIIDIEIDTIQVETLPDYDKSLAQTSPPDYGNITSGSELPDYERDSTQRELPPNYTANPLFTISETFPYYCTNPTSTLTTIEANEDNVIGACLCRGDRGCGGGKSVRTAKLLVGASVYSSK